MHKNMSNNPKTKFLVIGNAEKQMGTNINAFLIQYLILIVLRMMSNLFIHL